MSLSPEYRARMEKARECANPKCLNGANCPGHPWQEDELDELRKLEAMSRDMNDEAHRGAGFRQARAFFVAAHVEAEERQRGLEDRLVAVEKAWEMDRALHWTTDGADELVERSGLLTEALRLIRAELSHGATANWEFIGQTFDRALAVSSTENEEEQK